MFSLPDDEIVQQIYEKVFCLYNRLEKTRLNIDQVFSSIRKWSRDPLHQRSIYGRNLLDMRHQQERVRVRLLQCAETKAALNRILILNFCLFFNHEYEQRYDAESIQEVIYT